MICFQSENLLAPRPNPKLEDNFFSAVQDCFFNIFADNLHIGGRSFIRNLRTLHVVVIGNSKRNTEYFTKPINLLVFSPFEEFVISFSFFLFQLLFFFPFSFPFALFFFVSLFFTFFLFSFLFFYVLLCCLSFVLCPLLIFKRIILVMLIYAQ